MGEWNKPTMSNFLKNGLVEMLVAVGLDENTGLNQVALMP